MNSYNIFILKLKYPLQNNTSYQYETQKYVYSKIDMGQNNIYIFFPFSNIYIKIKGKYINFDAEIKYELEKHNYEEEFNYLVKGHIDYFNSKKVFFFIFNHALFRTPTGCNSFKIFW